MRIAIAILIVLHGVIHLIGFFKAFGIAEIHAIAQPISKPNGIVWLLASILFVTASILYLLPSNYWWVFAGVAVFLSQILIFNCWSDAKFGTIANIIILIASIIGLSNYQFFQKVQRERLAIFEKSQLVEGKLLAQEALLDLPPVVQKWLTASGVVGKPMISNVHLTQDLELKMNPEQTTWNHGKAEQIFTVQPPAFNWSVSTEMKSILSVVGRDNFEDGKGEMLIKAGSVIPVVNVKNSEKANQATMQRYLAEITWFPTVALSPHITWESIDAYSARATMQYRGTTCSGNFHFDQNGNFEKFVTMRYRDVEDTDPVKWTVKATKIEERNGVKIPVECEASWELDTGQWTWLRLKVTDITYNIYQ